MPASTRTSSLVYVLFGCVGLLASGCKSGGSATPDAPIDIEAAGSRTTREVPPKAPPAVDPGLEAQLARLERDAHYGLYLMGKKLGHARVWSRASADGEPGRYAMGFSMRMSVSGPGQKNEMVASEERYYAGPPGYALVETRFSSAASGLRDERRAQPVEVDGRPMMRITRSVGSKAQAPRAVAPSADTLLSQLAAMPLSFEGLVLGEPRSVSAWSWEREGDETISTTLVDISDRVIGGVPQRVARLALRYEASRLEGHSLFTADGAMLEMTLGAGLVLKLEERDAAQSGIEGLDIMGTALVSPTKLGSPHAIDALELTLSGPPSIALPSTANQTVTTTRSADGDRAVFTVVLTRGPGDPVEEADLAEALASDATMDSAHPAIVAKARALAEGLSSPREQVEAVAAWVYASLDKKLATHLPTASSILEARVGDCTEHTWLTIALLRALQIPARPVYGVGYTGDGERVFAYHAWVEVALEGRWHMIDPTWGQKSADATHLRLGSSFGEVASSIGGLTLEAVRIP